MTKPKAGPKKPTKQKQPPDPTRPSDGFLVCDTCKRVVPYKGMPGHTAAANGWPRHKCVNFQIRPFDRWIDRDPNRLPLSPRPGPLEEEINDSDNEYREVEI